MNHEPVTKEALEAGRQVYWKTDRTRMPSTWARWLDTSDGPYIAVAMPGRPPQIFEPEYLALVPVAPSRKESWINVYRNRGGGAHLTQAQADEAGLSDRLGPAVRVPLISHDGGKTWEVEK
jgi:hypothetical protein